MVVDLGSVIGDSAVLEQTAGIYNFVWCGMACAALWLLYRMFQILKAMHFMMSKWFNRDYIEPFERAHGIYDGAD
jgi:ribulose 1,5-bisphosphate synthetase/thiazole synthase